MIVLGVLLVRRICSEFSAEIYSFDRVSMGFKDVKLKLFETLIGMVLLLLVGLITLSVNEGLEILVVFTLVFSVYVAYRLYDFPAILFMVCFSLLFPFYVLPFVFFGIRISDYSEFQESNFFFIFLMVHNFFYVGLLAGRGVKNFNGSYRLSQGLPVLHGDLPAILFSVVLFFMVLMFRGKNIFLADNPYYAYTENLEVESGLPEYSLLIVFALALFKNLGNLATIIVRVVFAWLLYSLIIRGYRVQLLMVVVLYFLLNYESFVRSSYVVILFVIGFAIFALLGIVKDGGVENLDLKMVFFDDSPGFVLSHHTGVIYSSLAIVGGIHEGNITIADRAMNSLGIFINSVVPSGLVNSFIPQANIAMYAKNFTRTAGGVYAPIAFYSCLGWCGPILFGYFLSKLFYGAANCAGKSKLQYFISCWAIVAAATFPRWISYDVGNFLFRLPIYSAVLLIILIKISGRKNEVDCR